LFDPLYEENITNSSELVVFFFRHIFIELILPLSIFIATMLTFLVDWSWIPIQSIDRARGNSLEDIKKKIFE
tara:strand:+ start:625 stop:840 length:216 start_codon:yes stop_codon:yes gene_type:complete